MQKKGLGYTKKELDKLKKLDNSFWGHAFIWVF